MSILGLKLVTFDVTNTLLRFRLPPHEYYAHVARNYGFKGTGVNIEKQLLSSYKELTKQYPNFGKDSISWTKWWSRIVEMTFRGHLPKNAKIDCLSKKLIEDYKTEACWKIADKSTDLIKLLKKSGIEVGVISNFDPRLHDVLNNLNIGSYFEFVITSYEVGVSKPHKKIFECAQAKCSVSSAQCLHIGDDIDKDYDGAKAAGWNAVLVTDKTMKLPHNINVYANLRDLYSAIESNKIKLL